MKVALFGIGQFGYAILKHLDKHNNGRYDLEAWDIATEVVNSLRDHREHAWLHPGVNVSESITFPSSAEELLDGADVLILAVASAFTRDVMKTIRPHLKPGVILVNTAKALDASTGRRLSEIVAEELDGCDYHYAAISGGTIASDLFKHEPLGIDVAGTNEDAVEKVCSVFRSPSLRVYPTTDLAGVELAGSFKNVIAIFAGVVKGLGFSYGSETHMISRAATEVSTFATTYLGARPETFSLSSQCWGNDMWMSCTGKTRNRQYGILIGSGLSADKALEEMVNRRLGTCEGATTVKILKTLIEKYCQLDNYPILSGIVEITLNNASAREVFKKVMESGL